jgi:hypothetical protein
MEGLQPFFLELLRMRKKKKKKKRTSTTTIAPTPTFPIMAMDQKISESKMEDQVLMQ